MKQTLTILFICFALQSSGQNWVQAILDDYSDSIQSYGMVALVGQGDSILAASVGVSHKDHPVSIENRFCIGSCSKIYTATIIMKLHEKGVLNIYDSIYHFLPRHEYIDSTITIRQLLNHTSGITDFTKKGFVNEPLYEPHADYSDTYIMSKLDTIDFAKGTMHEYSNTNYFLLRKIIEIATDRPYEMSVRDIIIEPLELSNTFPYYSNQIEHLAHPIMKGRDLHQIPKLGTNAISRGAGNIVSDAQDINTFIRALLIEKTLLKHETLELMTEFYHYKTDKVGLGLFSETYGGKTVLGHTGRQVSYIAYAFADPTTGSSYVILTNNANAPYMKRVMEKMCSYIH